MRWVYPEVTTIEIIGHIKGNIYHNGTVIYPDALSYTYRENEVRLCYVPNFLSKGENIFIAAGETSCSSYKLEVFERYHTVYSVALHAN